MSIATSRPIPVCFRHLVDHAAVDAVAVTDRLVLADLEALRFLSPTAIRSGDLR